MRMAGMDLKKFFLLYRLGNMLAMTPWLDARWKPFNARFVDVLAKLWSCLWCACLGCGLYFSTTACAQRFRSNQAPTVVMLDCLEMTTMSFVPLGNVVDALLVKQKAWMALVQGFQGLNQRLKHDNSAATSCYVIFTGTTLILFSLVLYDALTSSECVMWLLVIFLQFCNVVYAILSMSLLALSIKCRYKELNIHLGTVVANFVDARRVVAFANTAEEIRNVGNIHRAINDVVVQYNAIFGWQIVLLFTTTIINLLGILNHVAVERGQQLSGQVTVHILQATLLVVGTVTIIFCCDSATSEGCATVRLCYKLQEAMPAKLVERKELLLLAGKTKYYAPSFTAWNLFDVRRSTVFGVISIITTYLIVTVQFNNSGK